MGEFSTHEKATPRKYVPDLITCFYLNSVFGQLQELLNLVTDARVGGMLSGKAGIVHFHTGSADSLLQPLWDVVNASKGAIPLTHMIPTHVSGRGPALLKVMTWNLILSPTKIGTQPNRGFHLF